MEASAIFSYSDFRAWLRDFYAHHKRHTPGYSFRSFSKAAGFSSPNFIKLVMEGKKNLTSESALKLAGAMELDAEASAYFQDLVQFGQAKSLETKRQYLERIDQRHRRNQPAGLENADAAYLRHWYLPAIREMTALPGFREDPQWIARRLVFPVPVREIRDAMKFLEDNGFLHRDGKNKLGPKERTLATGDMAAKKTLAMAARGYHLQMAELARNAVFHLPKDQRSVANTTLTLSRKGYETALKRIEALRFELLELAASESGTRDVFQLNVNLFPLTREEEE
jgi:uncharacterized protein (TIGR02147 family)